MRCLIECLALYNEKFLPSNIEVKGGEEVYASVMFLISHANELDWYPTCFSTFCIPGPVNGSMHHGTHPSC